MIPRRCSWPSALLPGLLLVGVLAGASSSSPSQASQDTGPAMELQVTQH